MKLLDLQERRTQTAMIYMAFFMEGTMPAQADLENISLQDTVNNCLIARPYMQGNYTTGGRMIMQPLNRADQTRIWPLHSTWQEVDGYYGKQVIPKTRCRRMRDLTVVANRTVAQQQVNCIVGAQLIPRFVTDPQNVNLMLVDAGGVATVNADATDATKTIPIEYDFGADVEITGVLKVGGSGQAAVNALYNSVLQAQIAGVWTDVTASGAPASNADTTIYPITLSGAKVTARYFRIRKLDATAQQYFGGFRFIGKYVNGTPRTYGKIGYVLMMPFARSVATFDATSFSSTNASCNILLSNEINSMDDRQVAWNAYSVTDDPKQINNFDLFMPNGLTFEQGSDLYPPFFTCVHPITEMGAV